MGSSYVNAGAVNSPVAETEAAGQSLGGVEAVPLETQGAEGTVTEVYSGANYAPADGKPVKNTVIAAGEDAAKVGYENEYEGTNNGGNASVVNHFVYGKDETGQEDLQWEKLWEGDGDRGRCVGLDQAYIRDEHGNGALLCAGEGAGQREIWEICELLGPERGELDSGGGRPLVLHVSLKTGEETASELLAALDRSALGQDTENGQEQEFNVIVV